jgi:rare lipoprotein A
MLSQIKFSVAILLFICIFSSCGKEPLETVEGTATFYGSFFHGKITTSGEEYNMNDLTAAHPTFSFGTKVKVINLENDKTVTVEINDRPRTNDKSRIDLSKEAFRTISELDSGVVPVRMEVLSWGEEKDQNNSD